MAGEQKPPNNPLEQFILLAKSAKGAALTALISQVLEAPGVYVFGELLELPCVQELSDGPNAGYYRLLNMFAYGTYPDYTANKEALPELSAAQRNKLKHLTIVSLAAQMKQCIPYSVLLRDLDVKNLRELEDLIIEAVYTDIFQGKLDQRNQLLEVDLCIGRDIQRKDTSSIVKTLQEWCSGCEVVLSGIEQQVIRADQCRENSIRITQQMDAEVLNIKKTLKATASTSAQDVDPHLMDRDAVQPADQRQTLKKIAKVRGLVSLRH
ncbi:COP9 signalosome complex subunit 7b-like isoform X1 [Erpetoichthys calabaricus]|uniref:COP9 signalosome subunit 7B n=1 Tax=Erpetoichthys calabaricus TaxID=27687 RepID=A0A8C4RWU4_ERPCA|nr:COP9 signalosome complex subunit 7b-like isoform X1 [Erpetoichthys calabaricus]